MQVGFAIYLVILRTAKGIEEQRLDRSIRTGRGQKFQLAGHGCYGYAGT